MINSYDSNEAIKSPQKRVGCAETIPEGLLGELMAQRSPAEILKDFLEKFREMNLDLLNGATTDNTSNDA